MSIVLGSKVVVADPVYELDPYMTIILRNVLSGQYCIHVDRKKSKNWGTNNYCLTVVHQEYVDKPLVWNRHKSKVDVDSGQAGIFDKKSYRNDETVKDLVWIKKKAPWRIDEEEKGELWYAKMSDMTLHNKTRWGNYEFGVVSSSGFGDGAYNLYTARVNNKVVGIAIDFDPT